MKIRPTQFILPLTLLLALFAFSWPNTAHAATLTVTTTADSGAGSLRNQIAAATAGDTIDFDASLSGQMITLTSGEIIIDKNLIIDGSALAEMVTISGNNNSRIFQVSGFLNGTVTFNNLRLINGLASNNNGGAVLIADSFGGSKNISFTQMVFENNVATFAGGAVRVSEPGTVTITQSTFVNNNAGSFGGAIENSNSSISISNSTFMGNQANAGGAVYNAGSMTADITNGTFLNNGASGAGSAVYNATNGILHLTNNVMYGTLAPPFDAPMCNSQSPLSTNSQNWIDYDDNCNPAFTGNPYLTPLADNGGATQTAALMPFSGAVNAATSNCPATDQRGVARGATCDLGAYEVGTADYAVDQCQAGLVQGETYTFGATGILITVDTLGSLTQLCVNLDQTSHPNATTGIQTGRHWVVTGTSTSNDWSLTMSAPATITLDGDDKLCRYTGSGTIWDCAMTGIDNTNNRITRSGVTELSDWALGNNVGPTAVNELQSSTTASSLNWLIVGVSLLMLMAGTVLSVFKRHI